MSSSAFTPTTTQVTTEVPVNVPVVTAWQSFTPTAVTNATTDKARFRRVGDTIEVQIGWTATGSVTNSFTQSQILPPNLSIDLTKLAEYNAGSENDRTSIGTYASVDVSVNIFAGIVVWNTTSAVAELQNLGFSIGSGDGFQISIRLPISQWSSGVTTLADRALEEYAWNSSETTTNDTLLFGNGPSGVAFRAFAPTGTNSITKRVRFQNSVLPTDRVVLEFFNGVNWNDASNALGSYLTNDAGNAAYGQVVRAVNGSTTDYDVLFHSLTAGQSVWGSFIASGWKWRLRKVSGGAQVGYPISTRNIVGDTSGTTVPTGMLGERLDGTWLNPSNAVGIKNAFSINLTSGTWMIYGKVYMQSSGATGYVDISCSISTVSNTSDNSSVLNNVNSTVSRDVICSSLPRCLTVSGPTPVYFVVSNSLGGGSFAAGWLQAASSFYAIRIA